MSFEIATIVGTSVTKVHLQSLPPSLPTLPPTFFSSLPVSSCLFFSGRTEQQYSVLEREKPRQQSAPWELVDGLGQAVQLSPL